MPKRFRSRSRSVTRRFKRRAIYRNRRGKINRRRSRMNTDTHAFRRWCTNGGDDTATGSWTQSIESTSESICPVFKFENLPNYTEFTNLYDQFKITKVTLHIQLVNNPDAGNILNSSTAGNNSSNWYPKLWYVRDYDDSSSLTLDDIRQYTKARFMILRPNVIKKIVVRPAVLVQAYNTALTNAYIPKWNQWIDAANYQIPYYGLKMVFDADYFDPADPAPFKVRFDVQYQFIMKCPR